MNDVSDDEFKQLKKLFNEIDDDGSGLLERDEVRELADNLGVTLSTAELDEAMAEMDEDRSGEVDFEEFVSWFAAAKEKGGSKWVTALNSKLDEYEREQQAFIRMMASGNTDGAMGNVNQMLAELTEEDAEGLVAAVGNIFSPIFDTAESYGGVPVPYEEVTEEQWGAVVGDARGRVLRRMGEVPTVYLTLHKLPAETKEARVETIIRKLPAACKPKFFDWAMDADMGTKEVHLEFDTAVKSERALATIKKELKMFGMGGELMYLSPSLLVTGEALTAAAVMTACGGQLRPLEIRVSECETFARMLMGTPVEALQTLRSVERGRGIDEAELTVLFNEIDEDGSGLLDREEVAQLSERLGAPLTKVKLDEAMVDMDEDGSGEVDFDEFKNWWGRVKDLIKAAQLCNCHDLVLFAPEEAMFKQFETRAKDYKEDMAGKLEHIRPLILKAKNLEKEEEAIRKIVLPEVEVQQKSQWKIVVVVLQRFSRGWLARRILRRKRQEAKEAAAATAINAVTRGHLTRRELVPDAPRPRASGPDLCDCLSLSNSERIDAGVCVCDCSGLQR